jgi:hypothetical protein
MPRGCSADERWFSLRRDAVTLWTRHQQLPETSVDLDAARSHLVVAAAVPVPSWTVLVIDARLQHLSQVKNLSDDES